MGYQHGFWNRFAFHIYVMNPHYRQVKCHIKIHSSTAREENIYFPVPKLVCQVLAQSKFLWLSYKPLKIRAYNGNTDTTPAIVAQMWLLQYALEIAMKKIRNDILDTGPSLGFGKLSLGSIYFSPYPQKKAFPGGMLSLIPFSISVTCLIKSLLLFHKMYLGTLQFFQFKVFDIVTDLFLPHFTSIVSLISKDCPNGFSLKRKRKLRRSENRTH